MSMHFKAIAQAMKESMPSNGARDLYEQWMQSVRELANVCAISNTRFNSIDFSQGMRGR